MGRFILNKLSSLSYNGVATTDLQLYMYFYKRSTTCLHKFKAKPWKTNCEYWKRVLKQILSSTYIYKTNLINFICIFPKLYFKDIRYFAMRWLKQNHFILKIYLKYIAKEIFAVSSQVSTIDSYSIFAPEFCKAAACQQKTTSLKKKIITC